jgi:hypothetical protein
MKNEMPYIVQVICDRRYPAVIMLCLTWRAWRLERSGRSVCS